MVSSLKEIQKELYRLSDEKVKSSVMKFVPHSQNIYGVKMPLLNEMAKRYKDGGFDLVNSLWQAGAFEEKILAAKVLGKITKKDPERALNLLRHFSGEISDWAVCDTLGMQSPKAINKSHAAEIFALSAKLISSKNLWERRFALVLTEWYTRDKAYHPRIHKLLDKVAEDKEYYVKKASEWLRKNFAKGK